MTLYNNEQKKISMLTLIAARPQREALLKALHQAGLKAVNTSYGVGTVRASYLQNLLGLVAEEKKIIITGLILEKKTQALFDMLVRDFQFNQPNTGIAFTTPVGKLHY